MPTASLILCEKSGRWALALRSALRGSVRLVETRALLQCYEALGAAPTSLVALAITDKNLSQALDLSARMNQHFPAARLLALLETELESAEPLLREAGFGDVFHSPQQAPAIALLALRHIALSPAEDRPLRELVAARLPWQAWATPGFALSITPPQE
jgi:hypothetical protein